MKVHAREHAARVEQRDVREAAKSPVSQQNIARAEHPVQRDSRAHVVFEKRQRQQADEHARGKIEQPHDLAHRIADAGRSSGGEREVRRQFRRILDRMRRAVGDEDAARKTRNDRRRLFSDLMNPLQQRLQYN